MGMWTQRPAGISCVEHYNGLLEKTSWSSTLLLLALHINYLATFPRQCTVCIYQQIKSAATQLLLSRVSITLAGVNKHAKSGGGG